MSDCIRTIPEGTITCATGFSAGAVLTGINRHPPLGFDLGIVYSDSACQTAAVFTTNRIKAAPVIVCKNRLPSSNIRALVVNSGIANACTGDSGLEDARQMAKCAAGYLGISEEHVLPMSTGVIGQRLPLGIIQNNISRIALSKTGGHDFARAIMTTDTHTKEIAVQVEATNGDYVIGGVAKGAGMIAPDMATTLCFIATDAAVEHMVLGKCIKKAVDISFNMITVDGDTSTNDTLLVMANGRSGIPPIQSGSRAEKEFQAALERVFTHLARCVVADGEGSTRTITVNVCGAHSVRDARLAARSIAGSNLVKAAVHGQDPNWGRILSAAGSSGALLNEAVLILKIGGQTVFASGAPAEPDLNCIARAMSVDDVLIDLDLNIGNARATAWGCDLSEEYVTINSEYTS